jgi:hypothetical protein
VTSLDVRRGRKAKAFVLVAGLVGHLGGDGHVVVMVEEKKRRGRVWKSVENNKQRVVMLNHCLVAGNQ